MLKNKIASFKNLETVDIQKGTRSEERTQNQIILCGSEGYESVESGASTASWGGCQGTGALRMASCNHKGQPCSEIGNQELSVPA